MPERPAFYPAQARELAEAFNAHSVDYMFIGKSGAILLGFPGTTQDVDVYPARSQENGGRIQKASKRAAKRARDLVDLPLLEAFREEYVKLHPPSTKED